MIAFKELVLRMMHQGLLCSEKDFQEATSAVAF